MRIDSSRLRRPLTTALIATALLAGFVATAPAAVAVPIDSAGPLTRVEVTPDLNCAVDHVGDVSSEFFGETACGTLLASGGILYGPAAIPAGGSASPRTAYTAVSQSPVTGSGTASDPFTIVTVVSLGNQWTPYLGDRQLRRRRGVVPHGRDRDEPGRDPEDGDPLPSGRLLPAEL